MLYAIVKKFTPEDGDSWLSYCNWRGITFERFDSIDGMLRPPIFTPEAPEDWDHVVCNDYMITYIIDRDYALKKQSELGQGVVVGLSYKDHLEDHPDFLGYDIIDSYCDISLLTNWGNDFAEANIRLASNGLVSGREAVEQIYLKLLQAHPEDPHVDGCRIVSIYQVENQPNAEAADGEAEPSP